MTQTETQKARLLEWLLLGLPLTGLTALKIGGGMKAATRLSELRREGWEDFIKREPVKVRNANGEDCGGNSIFDMTQRSRPIRIKKIADFWSGAGGFAPSYAFVFSDDLRDWMGSHNIEKKREVSRKHYRDRADRSGI